MSRRISAAPSFVAGLVLVDSALRARTRRVGVMEESIFRTVNSAPDAIHPPAWALMQAGSLAGVFVTAAGLAQQGHSRAAVRSAIAGTAVWGAVKLVKPAIGRGRPAAHLSDVSVRGAPQTGLGYPSGHAAVSMTLAVLATRRAPAGVRGSAMAVAVLTACARMYVGAHLPLDVAGGAAIGVVSARIADLVAERRIA